MCCNVKLDFRDALKFDHMGGGIGSFICTLPQNVIFRDAYKKITSSLKNQPSEHAIPLFAQSQAQAIDFSNIDDRYTIPLDHVIVDGPIDDHFQLGGKMFLKDHQQVLRRLNLFLVNRLGCPEDFYGK